MTELAIKPSIKKLAKKDDLSVDEAISIIKHYDNSVKSAGAVISGTYLESERKLSLKLNRIKRRNINKGLTATIGFMVTSFVAIIPAITSHAVGPEMGFLFFPTMGITVSGIVTLAKMEAGHHEKLHDLLSPRAHKAAKEEIGMTTELLNLKLSEFKVSEAKMLKKTAKALNVINESLTDKGETMIYDPVSEAGRGFVVIRKQEPELDQWDKLRMKLNPVEEQEKTLQLSK